MCRENVIVYRGLISSLSIEMGTHYTKQWACMCKKEDFLIGFTGNHL